MKMHKIIFGTSLLLSLSMLDPALAATKTANSGCSIIVGSWSGRAILDDGTVVPLFLNVTSATQREASPFLFDLKGQEKVNEKDYVEIDGVSNCQQCVSTSAISSVQINGSETNFMIEGFDNVYVPTEMFIHSGILWDTGVWYHDGWLIKQ